MPKEAVNRITYLVLLLGLLLGASGEGIAQSKKQLQRELALTNEFIAETRKNQEISFEEYTLLKEKMRLRSELLRKLKGEINENQKEIEQLDAIICKMEEDIINLKSNYSQTAKATYLSHDQNNFWLSLFSSGSLSEAYYRLMYYRQFSKHREQQIEMLKRSQQYLIEKSIKLNEKAEFRKVLVAEQLESENILKKEEGKAEKMASNLKSRYAEYKAKKRQEKQLVKTAINKSEKSWDAVYSSTQAENKSSFTGKKGLLNWPVKRSRCIITGKFGKTEDAYGNPITNDGIFIRTQVGEPILSVFNGTVTAVQNLPLGGKMVVVAHGEYRTTYSNLDRVIVRKGDQISSGQRIGTIHTDSRTGESVLQFLIYKLPGTFVNPELWLADYTRGSE